MRVWHDIRSDPYSCNLTTTSVDLTLKVSGTKGIPFETAIIERYRRRESNVEEALADMAGVLVQRFKDITTLQRLCRLVRYLPPPSEVRQEDVCAH